MIATRHNLHLASHETDSMDTHDDRFGSAAIARQINARTSDYGPKRIFPAHKKSPALGGALSCNFHRDIGRLPTTLRMDCVAGVGHLGGVGIVGIVRISNLGIDELVLPERNDIAILKGTLPDAFIANKYTVGTVEILDNASRVTADYLCVISADKITVDADVTFRVSTDDDSSGLERVY